MRKGHEDDWKGHPFHKENNINGIDGDLNHDGKGLEVHQLGNPKITDHNERFVKKVIDVVNEFGNVLYEITNENDGSQEDTAWQYHMINFIKAYQSTKPNQHPVGMTVQWPNGTNEAAVCKSCRLDFSQRSGRLSDRPADSRRLKSYHQ